MKLCLLLVATFVLVGCPSPKPSQDPVTFDGGTCVDACFNVTQLVDDDGKPGCDGFRPTKKDAVCLDVCVNAFANGGRWNLRCIAAAESCSAARDCPSVE